jgi:hypothetical protein
LEFIPSRSDGISGTTARHRIIRAVLPMIPLLRSRMN